MRLGLEEGDGRWVLKSKSILDVETYWKAKINGRSRKVVIEGII